MAHHYKDIVILPRVNSCQLENEAWTEGEKFHQVSAIIMINFTINAVSDRIRR